MLDKIFLMQRMSCEQTCCRLFEKKSLGSLELPTNEKNVDFLQVVKIEEKLITANY